ncbi:MAG: hypothetical protein Q8O53_01250, partial [Candidatus Moranbacteria bacterium]|nr:hypothetical protein [Candidatus Moranbacteria bacterium]
MIAWPPKNPSDDSWRNIYRRMKRYSDRITPICLPIAIFQKQDDRFLKMEDDFFTFCIWSWTLKNYLEMAGITEKTEELYGTSSYLSLCFDIANGTKHVIISKKQYQKKIANPQLRVCSSVYDPDNDFIDINKTTQLCSEVILNLSNNLFGRKESA